MSDTRAMTMTNAATEYRLPVRAMSYVAMVLGIVFSVILGAGLMARMLAATLGATEVTL